MKNWIISSVAGFAGGALATLTVGVGGMLLLEQGEFISISKDTYTAPQELHDVAIEEVERRGGELYIRYKNNEAKMLADVYFEARRFDGGKLRDEWRLTDSVRLAPGETRECLLFLYPKNPSEQAAQGGEMKVNFLYAYPVTP